LEGFEAVLFADERTGVVAPEVVSHGVTDEREEKFDEVIAGVGETIAEFLAGHEAALEVVVELGREFADEFGAAFKSAAKGGAILETAADVK